MAEDILGYLHSKGIKTKKAGGDNIHTACFFHGEDPSDRGRLYINTNPDAEIPGLFICFVCQEKGSLARIYRHFGDIWDNSSPEVLPQYSLTYRILQDSATYYHKNLLDMPEKIEWLRQERGLSDETIEKHKLGWADGKLIDHLAEKIDKGKYTLDDIKNSNLFVTGPRLVDFLQNVITIPYHVSGSVVMIRGKEIGGKYFTPPGAKTRLYNTDVLFGAAEAVITEGEFDALLMEQLGYAAVGCPGASIWQDSFNPYFDEIRRVVAIFDNDSAGRKGLERVKENLGIRVRTITVPQFAGPEDHNDITSWIVEQGHIKSEVDALIVRAQGGLLLTVDDAYKEFNEQQGLEGLQFGIDLLDDTIVPGLLPSQVAIILAKTGTGKTISLLNFFHRMKLKKNDIKILFLSLEQTRGDWFERARRIYAFYNVNEIQPGESEQEVIAYREEINRRTVEHWRDNLMMVDKNRVSEDELISCLSDYSDMFNRYPDIIAVDYLGYWASGFKGKDKYEKTTEAVMKLKSIAKDFRIPIIAPHQVNRGAEFGTEPQIDAARDSGAVEETADFVFTLWTPDHQKETETIELTGDINLRIAKSRHGGKSSLIKMVLAPSSLALIPFGSDKLYMFAKDEVRYRISGKLAPSQWEQAIYFHSRPESRIGL